MVLFSGTIQTELPYRTLYQHGHERPAVHVIFKFGLPIRWLAQTRCYCLRVASCWRVYDAGQQGATVLSMQCTFLPLERDPSVWAGSLRKEAKCVEPFMPVSDALCVVQFLLFCSVKTMF